MGPANKSRDDECRESGMSAVCMMASRKHGTLYIGVTSDLLLRVSQHREGAPDGFTKRLV